MRGPYSVLTACFVLGFAGAVVADQAAPSVWLSVDEPVEGTSFGSAPPWVEIRGWAGTAGVSGHDVVVVVDLSGSTAGASGVDVDEDGEVGKGSRRRVVTRFVSSDPEDTVLAAELSAIRRLSDQIDRKRNRMGIVSFASRPRIETALGTTHDDLELALRNLEGAFASGGTNLGKAIEKAIHMLDRDDADHTRERSILILSDGEPTVPAPAASAARAAVDATKIAARKGIRVHAFALHLPPARDTADEAKPGVYERIVEVGGGSLVRVEKPGHVIHELPEIRLGGVANIEIANLSTGEGVRAQRVFPDGSFDAFVRLVRGENRLRVSALSPTGERVDVTRTVHYAPSEARDAVEAESFRRRRDELLERLRERAVESELARRASRRDARQLELELGVEPGE